MDIHLQQSIDKLEEDFYTSLLSGPSQLEAFAQSWTVFVQSLSALTSKASSSTMERFQELSAIVATMASGLLEYEETKHRIDNELTHDISNIIDNELAHPSSLPRYLEPSWKWLCANLHNPYPPQAVREQIATDAKVPRRMVDSWFNDARKRIGWNDIRKSHFSNKHDTIEAATRFFISCDDLGPALEVRFARMESMAKELYSSKFMLNSPRTVQGSRSASPFYPTPAQSPRANSPASRCGEKSVSPSSTSRKRSLSTSSQEARPVKRSRFHEVGSLENVQNLPTPPSSQSLCYSPTSDAALQNPPSSPSPLSSKRKRRLSFCDEERRPKRPTQSSSEPRRHVVSDPLPSSVGPSLDTWYSSLFDDDSVSLEMPGSCQVGMPADFPLDIEFANFASSAFHHEVLQDLGENNPIATLPASIETTSTEVLPSHLVTPLSSVESAWNQAQTLEPSYTSSGSPSDLPLWDSAYLVAPLSQEVATLPNPSLSQQVWAPQGPSDFLTAPTPHNFIYAQQPPADASTHPLTDFKFPTLDFPPDESSRCPRQSLDKTEAIRQEVQDLRQKLLALEAQLAVSS